MARFKLPLLIFLAGFAIACGSDPGKSFQTATQPSGGGTGGGGGAGGGGGEAAPPQISNIAVSNLTPVAATINWTTDQPAQTHVDYGTPLHIFQNCHAPALTTQHACSLTALIPGSTYLFRVTSTNAQNKATTSEISTFSTVMVAGTPDSALTISSFSVVEVQYPDAPGWYYAPQVDVTETSGRGPATVVSMSFTIPGLGNAPAYTTGKCVGAGQRQTLLNEVYGDYELTIDQPGVRSSAGEATVTLTFMDSNGRTAKATGRGPVVAGTFPTTYTGGQVSWPCR